MDYYRVLTDDSRYGDRWFLDEPLTETGIALDAREFRYGRPYSGPAPRVIPVGHPGRRVAFNLGAFDMPVVSGEIADMIKAIAPADIQRFPITIGDGIEGYEILNAIAQERCVDEVRSRVRKWVPEDGRPDKVGQYRDIGHLVIDPQRTGGRHFFRISGSLVELIVSEEVRRSLLTVDGHGVVFDTVNG